MVEELRILCEDCIAEYAFRREDVILPAMVVSQGKSYCWKHYLEFSTLGDRLKVEYDSTTYPPSYSISRKSK